MAKLNPDAPRDRFGFLLDGEEICRLDRAAAATQASVVSPRQCKAWAEIAAVVQVGKPADVVAALKSTRKTGKLKAMVRGGIPCAWNGV